MKAILSLIMLSNLAVLNAREIQFAEETMPHDTTLLGEGIRADIAFDPQPFALSQKNDQLKVENLEKQLALQKRAYEDKIHYLQGELKKSQYLLVEKSVHQLKQEKMLTKNFAEETTFLKKELVVRNKKIMEFQRLVEKFKPGQDTRDLILTNSELSTELRKATDYIANIAIVDENKKEAIANAIKSGETKSSRLPASVETKNEVKK